ncbi:hypothetical protein KKF61_03350 [Patescibacteria group bacterium]|nr:hypothetical protein [Patescibacteria group bacterium]MBU0964585.1 hypothetical protein [Patescibacteria group bacterium]
MVKKLIIAIIVIVIHAVIGIYFWSESAVWSDSQQELIDTFGSPQMFTVSYLPHGEGENLTLVRHETWVYPDHQQEITFIGGEIFSMDDYTPEQGDYTYTSLTPADFDFE